MLQVWTHLIVDQLLQPQQRFLRRRNKRDNCVCVVITFSKLGINWI